MTEPLQTTTLIVWGRRKVNVKIWRNMAEVTRAWRGNGNRATLKRGQGIRAFYEWETVDGMFADSVGTLHFALDHFGAGIVAHEIQHVVMRWCAFMDWDFWSDIESPYHERTARMTEKLTRRLWKWYWKNVSPKKSKDDE